MSFHDIYQFIINWKIEDLQLFRLLYLAGIASIEKYIGKLPEHIG